MKKNKNIFTYLLFIVVIIMAAVRYVKSQDRVNLTNEDLTLDTYVLASYDEQEDYIYLYFDGAVVGIIDKSSSFDVKSLDNYIDKELNVYYIDTNEVDIDFEVVVLNYEDTDIHSLDMFINEAKRMQNINLFFIFFFPLLFVVSLFFNSNFLQKKIRDKKEKKINLDDPVTRSNYDKIRGAILYRNNGYVLSNKLDVDDDTFALLLPKVLFDITSEKELKVIKEADDGYIISFKVNNELFFEYTIKDKNNDATIGITYSYPSERRIEQEELSLLKDELERYNSMNNTNIKIWD